MKKAIMILSIVMLITLSFTTVAMAATTVQSYTNGSHTFSKDWSETKTKTHNGAKCVLTYGFNTFLINEDIAYAYTDGGRHHSRIINNNGNSTHDGPTKVANEWSDIEVTHRGNSVTYRQIWN